MTADKWMPMQEVREPEVEEYLLSKRAEGYALLGIEQATRSVSLEKFTFPEKSLLLLGLFFVFTFFLRLHVFSFFYFVVGFEKGVTDVNVYFLRGCREGKRRNPSSFASVVGLCA